jgi:hypothetical protein
MLFWFERTVKERKGDAVIGKLEERIGILENKLNEMKKQPNTDVM